MSKNILFKFYYLLVSKTATTIFNWLFISNYYKNVWEFMQIWPQSFFLVPTCERAWAQRVLGWASSWLCGSSVGSSCKWSWCFPSLVREERPWPHQIAWCGWCRCMSSLALASCSCSSQLPSWSRFRREHQDVCRNF